MQLMRSELNVYPSRHWHCSRRHQLYIVTHSVSCLHTDPSWPRPVAGSSRSVFTIAAVLCCTLLPYGAAVRCSLLEYWWPIGFVWPWSSSTAVDPDAVVCHWITSWSLKKSASLLNLNMFSLLSADSLFPWFPVYLLSRFPWGFWYWLSWYSWLWESWYQLPWVSGYQLSLLKSSPVRWRVDLAVSSLSSCGVDWAAVDWAAVEQRVDHHPMNTTFATIFTVNSV